MDIMKILVVDDNQEDLLLMDTILTHSGYEVEKAANGAEALGKGGLMVTNIFIM